MINRPNELCVAGILGIILFLSGCGYFESKEEIAAWVKKSMQTEMQKDNAYKGLSIGQVALVRESISKFTGYIEFKYGTDTEKANLIVTVDGNEKMYQCEPPRALILKRNFAQLGGYFNQNESPSGAAPVTAPNPFSVNNNGTVSDGRTGLMWASKDNGIDINWASAKSYCENYRGAGYTDWRMPTLDELERLYASGGDNVRDKINFWVSNTPGSYADYFSFTRDTGVFWALDARGSEVAYFSLTAGLPSWVPKSYDGKFCRVLPVRSGK